MHVYGQGGEVVFKFEEDLAVITSIEEAETAQRQLGCAIREAQLAAIGQARLFAPPVSAAGGTL